MSSVSAVWAHRVLFIPELLQTILSFMNRSENVINACVCKQWSEIALDLIWREVNSLPRLLTLLRPYRKRSGANVRPANVFNGQPDLRDWARFQKYANRVRTLRYKQGRADYSPMLDDMARTRTTLEILPNLHTLEWLFHSVDCMERATLFMHPRVRHLVVSAPPFRFQTTETKPSLFVDICTRMPHLCSLDLRAPYAVKNIEADLVELLRSLPDLQKVIFPEFYFTSTIVTELSRMKHISIMQFEHGDEQGSGRELDLDSFAPVLEEGAFPTLRDLAITASFEDLIRFMTSDFAPINIRSLYISSYVELQPEQLHALLVILSGRCHLLSELYIKLLHIPTQHALTQLELAFSEHEHIPTQLELIPSKQITYDTLRPLLSFRNLSTFEVIHKFPVHITLEEIEELASRWPSLKSLSLNEEPLVMDDFTLDLRALIPFSRHCPKLRRLGLFMDANATKLHPVKELELLSSLRTLSVGTSRLRDPDIVAAFLSHICPPECKLEVGITWTSYNDSTSHKLGTQPLFEMRNRSAPWDTVKHLLPVLIRLRREEKEKSRALQEEVEDLRTRNRLLMDKANIKADDSCVVV